MKTNKNKTRKTLGKAAAATMLASLLILLAACSSAAADGADSAVNAKLRTETEDSLLGTVISISAYTDSDAAFEACFDAIKDIDRRMTVNSSESEISKANLAAGEGGVKVSPDTQKLLVQAKEISEASGGAFDVSVGSITSLWKIDGVFSRLSSPDEVKSRLSLVSSTMVRLDANGSLSLDRKGMSLDLGGIAKGYACDLAVEELKKNGVRSAFLDLGGNIYALGHKEGGKKWRIGIRYPEIGGTAIACVIEAADKAVVTSGGYERYFEKDGKTYHHILDPKTGYPAESGLKSVSIVADSSATADALSTACFVLGLDRGMELMKKYPDCDAIFITDKGELVATDGLRGEIEIGDSRITYAADAPETEKADLS